jgi:hypothetical protein
MVIVEGTHHGKTIKTPKFIYLTEFTTGDHRVRGFGSSIVLKNNLVSIDVLSENKASGGGIQGAASGAVLGFLVAGPLGTAIGAGVGSKKKGRDGTTLLLTWANGDYWIVNNVEPEKIGILKLVTNTSNHIQSLPNNNKKLPPDSNIKTKRKNKKSIEKPKKLPKNPPLKTEGGFKFVKRRTPLSKTSLPKLALIEKLRDLDESKEATNLFQKSFNDEVQNYNNWKWRHFDLKIETEKEVEALATRTFLGLIFRANETPKIKSKVSKLRSKLSDIQETINEIEAQRKDQKSVLEAKRKDLADTGFFKRGPIKKEIQQAELRLQREQETLDKTIELFSKTRKEIEPLEQTVTIDVASDEFIAMHSEVFPNLLKLKKTSKIKLNFDKQFYLDTYRNVFDETWDKRVDAALKKQKMADDRQKEKQVAKSKSSIEASSSKTKKPSNEGKSKKAQLIELNELLEEGLISNDEYESSRKIILGLSQ